MSTLLAVAEIAVTPEATSTGLLATWYVPLPTWPAKLMPHAYTWPLVVTAYEVARWRVPGR
jgi:hypothetical protein